MFYNWTSSSCGSDDRSCKEENKQEAKCPKAKLVLPKDLDRQGYCKDECQRAPSHFDDYCKEHDYTDTPLVKRKCSIKESKNKSYSTSTSEKECEQSKTTKKQRNKYKESSSCSKGKNSSNNSHKKFQSSTSSKGKKDYSRTPAKDKRSPKVYPENIIISKISSRKLNDILKSSSSEDTSKAKKSVSYSMKKTKPHEYHKDEEPTQESGGWEKTLSNESIMENKDDSVKSSQSKEETFRYENKQDSFESFKLKEETLSNQSREEIDSPNLSDERDSNSSQESMIPKEKREKVNTPKASSSPKYKKVKKDHAKSSKCKENKFTCLHDEEEKRPQTFLEKMDLYKTRDKDKFQSLLKCLSPEEKIKKTENIEKFSHLMRDMVPDPTYRRFVSCRKELL